jgi:hypothetical protein
MHGKGKSRVAAASDQGGATTMRRIKQRFFLFS